MLDQYFTKLLGFLDAFTLVGLLYASYSRNAKLDFVDSNLFWQNYETDMLGILSASQTTSLRWLSHHYRDVSTGNAQVGILPQ